ncbi:MAG TPA: IS66 family transposase [Gemmatimonadaceae bacterium]|nr:IS66 family transposase [Gemmatimonadaceae bacterium]
MPDVRTPPGPDDRDARIKQQQEEIARLRDALKRSEQERERLKRRNERLEDQLDAARRAGFRQAAPFAKPHRQGSGHPPGRRAGATYGRHGTRPVPQRIDDTHDAALPAACPRCGGDVHETHVVSQYQEDLPVVRPVIREFRVHVGACTQCGRRVQGRHRLQTSDALGAAAVQIGPEAAALVVVLHKSFGLPLAHVARLLRDRFGIRVTRGALVHVCARVAARATPTYDALCAQVRGSPLVSPDETGWNVAGTLHWLWAFATPDTTVYAIRPGRGYDDAASVLGEDFAGVLARDGWAPYRRFVHAEHQTCLAHLLRRCRLLRIDHPRSPFAARLQHRLQQALALRDRHAAGAVSAHGLAIARGRLLDQTLDLLTRTRSDIPAVQRFVAHLTREASALFTFLGDPAVDATNWRAEHAIRPAVVMRKVCGGNRSAQGATTQQVLTSLLRTAHQRALDPTPILVTLLRAPTPIVPLTLQAPLQ